MIEPVVNRHCGPGVNEFSDWTATLRRAPPVGSTGELHLHQQLVVFHRDGDGGRAEGFGGSEEKEVNHLKTRH